MELREVCILITIFFGIAMGVSIYFKEINKSKKSYTLLFVLGTAILLSTFFIVSIFDNGADHAKEILTYNIFVRLSISVPFGYMGIIASIVQFALVKLGGNKIAL